MLKLQRQVQKLTNKGYKPEQIPDEQAEVLEDNSVPGKRANHLFVLDTQGLPHLAEPGGSIHGIFMVLPAPSHTGKSFQGGLLPPGLQVDELCPALPQIKSCCCVFFGEKSHVNHRLRLLLLLGTNCQHRDMGTLDHPFRNGAEQDPVQSLAAVGAHDD